MKRNINMQGINLSKSEQIKAGEKVNTQIGGVYAKEKKFEEGDVTRKKRNYVTYESKSGTERKKDLQNLNMSDNQNI